MIWVYIVSKNQCISGIVKWYTRCMNKLYKLKYILGLGLLLVFAGLLFMGLKSYGKWGGSHYFGAVSEVSDSRFIVVGRKGVPQVFTITIDTIVKRGFRSVGGAVQVGDRVTVSGVEIDGGYIEARLIRIMGHVNTTPQSQ